MKRKLAGLLTALMVLAVGTTAFAAPSRDTSSVGSGSSSAPSTSQGTVIGNASNTDITPVSEAVAAAAESVAKSVSPDAEVLAVVDVTFDGEIPAGGVQMSFSLAGVQAGEDYVLLHQLADGRWEMITPDSIGNGVIKATFHSLSPVAFVKLPKQNSGNTGTSGTTGTAAKPSGTVTGTSSTAAGSAAASPKTGAALPVLPVLAMVCVAGIVVCGRKVKFND